MRVTTKFGGWSYWKWANCSRLGYALHNAHDLFSSTFAQWRRQRFLFGFVSIGDRMESKGEASVGVEAEAVYRHCLQILTAETIKIWKFRTIHFLVLD